MPEDAQNKEVKLKQTDLETTNEVRGTDILSKTVKLSEEIKEPGTSGDSRTEINEEPYGETQTKDSEENEKLYEADYEVDDEAVVSLGKFIAPDQHASLAGKLIFVREHPIQPLNVTQFNANRVYSRQLPDGNILTRQWLSYNSEIHKIFCSVCMAFSADRKCPFVSGFMCDKRHLYDRIVKHEKSNLHEAASNVYLRVEKRCTVDDLLNKEQESEKETRRQVLERIIPIIFLLVDRESHTVESWNLIGQFHQMIFRIATVVTF